MPKYLRIKTEIEGVSALSEAVRAVEVVAASHIHQLRKAAGVLQDYIADVRRVLVDVSAFYALEKHPLLRPKEHGSRVLIVVTGDRGLVGGLYLSVLEAFAEARSRYDRIAVIGEAGKRLFDDEGFRADDVLPDVSPSVTAEEAGKISGYALGQFVEGDAAAVDVLYPRFVSIAEQRPTIAPFLPFAIGSVNDGAPSSGLPIFEPSRSAVADRLLRVYVGLFFTALLSEAKLSEFSARTVAMEHSAAQADGQVRSATFRYFKERKRDLSRSQIESFFAHKSI